jgi:hypothetical protein
MSDVAALILLACNLLSVDCEKLVCKSLSIDCQEQQGPSASALMEFQRFWSEFRAAVKANDKDRVASLTEFPFELAVPAEATATKEGPSEATVRKYDKPAFVMDLDRLLDIDTGLVHATNETMRSFIDRTTEVPREKLWYGPFGEPCANLGKFNFAKRDGRWTFVSAIGGREN